MRPPGDTADAHKSPLPAVLRRYRPAASTGPTSAIASASQATVKPASTRPTPSPPTRTGRRRMPRVPSVPAIPGPGSVRESLSRRSIGRSASPRSVVGAPGRPTPFAATLRMLAVIHRLTCGPFWKRRDAPSHRRDALMRTRLNLLAMLLERGPSWQRSRRNDCAVRAERPRLHRDRNSPGEARH
jgi:hypothetical protein